jgi:Arc/MetJ-type ribon-helix-helix transcriptional regulator
MERTTVYLPRELKRALEETSRRRRVSEAELIREGVAAVIRDEQPAEPTLPLFASGEPDVARNVEEALRGFGEA